MIRNNKNQHSLGSRWGHQLNKRNTHKRGKLVKRSDCQKKEGRGVSGWQKETVRTTRTVKISIICLFTVIQWAPGLVWRQFSRRMRWIDRDFPILDKMQCCGFPPASPQRSLTKSYYPGRRIVMELGGSSGNWGAAQLCLGQIQFFFFFFFFGKWSQEHNCGNFPICLFLSPFMLCYSNLLSPQSTEQWDYDPEMGSLFIFSSCISYSAERRKWITFSLWTMVMFPPPPSTKLMPTAF